MSNITLTEVDVAIPEFWASVALGALKANTVMAQLVRRDFDSEVATQGDTVNVIKRGALAVNSKTINTNVSLQNPANSKVPVVLDTHNEVSFLVEDVASAKAIDSAMDYVEDAAIVIAEDVDSTLTALYVDIVNDQGATAIAMDVADIVKANKQLNIQKCPRQGRVLVVSAAQEAALLNDTTFTSSDFGGDDPSRAAMIEAVMGRRFGFDLLMDQQIQTTSSGPGIEHAMAFHRDAFALVSRTLPVPPNGSGALGATVSEDGIGMRSIRAYNASALGLQFTVDILFGVKSIRPDTHAVHVETGDQI